MQGEGDRFNLTDPPGPRREDSDLRNAWFSGGEPARGHIRCIKALSHKVGYSASN